MSIDPISVGRILLTRLENEYENQMLDGSPEDSIFADFLLDLIRQKVSDLLVIEEEVGIVENEFEYNGNDFGFDDELSDSDAELEVDSLEPASSQESYLQPSTSDRKNLFEEFTWDQMVTIRDERLKYGNQRCFKRWTSLRHDHKKLDRIVKFVDNGGDKKLKLLRVKQYMFAKFRSHRDRIASVHDINLKRWAFQAAREQRLDNFKASHCFIQRFKKETRISSRKITKWYTRPPSADEEALKATSARFVSHVNDRKFDECFDDAQVWNTDQSGFNYEMTRGRTLSDRGQKDTYGLVQSINASTHSYTIQVLFSNAGALAEKVFICFQEREARFGRITWNRIKDDIPKNVYVDCSKSGNLTKDNVRTWTTNCLVDEISDTMLLIQDSWTGQSDQAMFNQLIPNHKELLIETVPPKCTKYAQPLDVYFFRQFKFVMRIIADNIRAEASDPATIEIRLNDRRNIMFMVSFVYGQFKAPIFRNMLLYAWQKSGFTTQDRVTSFQNADEVLFQKIGEKCQASRTEQCPNDPILKCSLCKRSLCTYHCLFPLPHVHYHQ